MTINDIIAIGRQIAAETAEGGNTAARVGGVIEAIGEALKNQDYMSWQPAGDFDIETYYEKNDQVFDAETNSCYLSLQTDNVGHPVNENDEAYEEGWWMKVIDGSSIIAAAEAATQAAAEANQAAEAARGIVYQAVDDHLDTESLKPVANQVVTQAINNLSENLQDVEEEMFDATHVIKDNIFDWDVAGLPTTNNNSYITPSRTEDGARWTIKTAAPTTNRNGAVKLPSLVLGKTYCVKLAYNNALNANAEVTLCKYDSGTAPGNVNISYVRRNLAILPKMASGEVTFTFKYDVTTIQYLAFIFVQPAKNQYLEISDLTISECKSLDDLDIVDDYDAESDLDITDEQDNILARFAEGHVITKNFDSRDIGDLGLTTTKFKNKKFAIIGDSISTFSGWLPSDRPNYDGAAYSAYYTPTRGDVTSPDKTWWYKTLKYLGITPVKWENVNNCSWSGSRVSGDSASTTTATAACSERRITDVGLGDFNPDIILVFISCNDWYGNVAVGNWSIADSIPSDGTISELRASYALMLHKLHTHYPDARIFCCTNLDDPRRDKVSGWPSNNNNGVTTHQWNQNIKEIAEAFGCDVIDMHACGINYQNFTSLAVDEGTHPNAAGMTLMAKKVSAELIAKY